MAKRDMTGAIDASHLRAYTAGDAALIEEVLGLFAHQIEVWLPLLDPAGEGWRDAAHTLKGGALGIGAWTLAQLCGEAEGEADRMRRTLLVERVRTAADGVLNDAAAWRHQLALDGLKTPG